MKRKQTIIQASVLMVAMAAGAKPLAETIKVLPAIAQEATAPLFKLPATLPEGTKIVVDGSHSMSVPNAALKKRFEEKYTGTEVTLESGGTPEALEALAEGKIDLASIGRPLTNAEKAKGLQETLLKRGKIAVIVSPSNPFKGNVSFDQFAKIFRGEITNWKEVGGEDRPIKFVDQPEASDTRLALSKYKVFEGKPFITGPNAIKSADDTSEEIVKELGDNGISYVIADQVLDNPNVRILEMHKTLPTDPRYPYSQPRGYAYTKDPKPGTQAFLGFATSEPGKEIVTEAIGEASPSPTASPSVAASPEASPNETVSQAPAATTAAAEQRGGFPWWLLLLPLAGLLFWFLRPRGGAAPVAAPVAAPIAAPVTPEGRIILTPRDCRNAYAYWEVPQASKDALKRQGGKKLFARLCDVTGIDYTKTAAHRVEQFDCKESDPDLHIPIPQDDRDYLVELGYTKDDGGWLPLCRSEHVRVPACKPDVLNTTVSPIETVTPPTIPPVVPAIGVAAAAAGAAAIPGLLGDRAETTESRVILTPRTCRDAYAYWEVPESAKNALKAEGGKNLMVRLYDVTGINLDREPANRIEQFECSESDPDRHIPIPVDNRDYLVEVGYTTESGGWLPLCRSEYVRVPACKPDDIDAVVTAPAVPDVTTTPSSNGGLNLGAVAPIAGAVAGAAAVAGLVGGDKTPAASRMTLSARGTKQAYAYWQVPDAAKAAAKAEGGVKPQVRFYDVTGIDMDHTPAHNVQVFGWDEKDNDRILPVPSLDRDYIAEVGYETADQKWIKLARSNHIRVPSGGFKPAAGVTQAIKVHNRGNCYLLTPEEMNSIQQKAVSTKLEPGIYKVRIKDGAFDYKKEVGHVGEPWVLLWIYGGKVINKKTNVPVPATWTTLNGYEDELILEVIEPATLSAFFIDTFIDDNEGEVTLSVSRS